MSDENTYAPQVIDTLVWLGRLANGRSDQLRGAVAKAVAAFYSEQPDYALKEGEFTTERFIVRIVYLFECLCRTTDDKADIQCCLS